MRQALLGFIRLPQGNRVRVSKAFDANGGATFSLGYKYNANDKLIRITYPSGRIVNFLRDAAGRVASVDTNHNGVSATLASNVTLAGFGPLTGFHYGAASSSLPAFSRPVDLSYRPTGLTHTNIVNRQYSYMDGGVAGNNITGITDLITAGKSQTLSYDRLDRLVSATSSGAYGSLVYSPTATPYDGIGNRTTVTTNGVSQTYAYEPEKNRLTSIGNGGPAYSNDPYVGNAVARQLPGGPLQEFGHSPANRFTSITSNGERLATYGYAYDGHRGKKAIGGKTIRYMYGVDDVLLAEIDGSGMVLQEYAYLDGLPIALLVPETGSASTDSDGDGIPDSWELSHGLDPNSTADAAVDSDADGLTNLQEFQRSTDPHNDDTDGDTVLDGQDPAPTSPSWIVPLDTLQRG